MNSKECEEQIEELAFKDRNELANLNEIDLLEIIEFLQIDRKQWINQYTQAHNDYVNLQQENQQLKEKIIGKQSSIKALKEALKERTDERDNHYDKERLYKGVIKEIREYIKKNKLYTYKYDDEELFEITTDEVAKEDLSKILDKGEKNDFKGSK